MERDLYDLPGGFKLCPEAFVAEALDQAGQLDDANLLAMNKTLRDSPTDYAEIAGSLRRMERAIAEPTIRRAKFKRPHLLNQYCSEGALADLAKLQWDAKMLWALAAYRVAGKRPEVFGPLHDFDEASARVEVLDARLAELYRSLETRFTGDDVQFLDTSDLMRREGYTAMGYKLSGGVVRCGVGSGKHLVDWLLAHPEQIP
jgi:hypothetical protein